MNYVTYENALPLIDKAISTPITILICLSFIGLAIYFAKKLPPILSTQNVLIANNTKATESMSKSVDMLGNVLQNMVTNYAVHDEGQKALRNDVNAIQSNVSDLIENSVTKNELLNLQNNMQNRFDTVITNMRR
ncbi:MAG: hypothetical protein K0Q53_60 [Massilibacillus sp.]|jgi:hypothetical protein|nr:hypothetical protein [Massilibacillus sp.]